MKRRWAKSHNIQHGQDLRKWNTRQEWQREYHARPDVGEEARSKRGEAPPCPCGRGAGPRGRRSRGLRRAAAGGALGGRAARKAPPRGAGLRRRHCCGGAPRAARGSLSKERVYHIMFALMLLQRREALARAHL
ncbi:unnamed protein product, partial [Prorocentrum cordatum]